MTDILIQGINGRMGRVLCDLIAERQDCRVVAGVDLVASQGVIPVFTDFEDVNVKADVLIDFSSPAATQKAVAYCKKHHLPAVICTTGLSEEIQKAIDDLAKETAVFKSGNMSMGINLLCELCRVAEEILGDGYDVEIIEKHHHNKMDAPSGTALMLADSVNEQAGGKFQYVYERKSRWEKRQANELGISSIRGGSIVGEHEVMFCGPDEVITLQHTAYSRSVFANGAVNAAIFIAGKQPGYYSMNDLIREKL